MVTGHTLIPLDLKGQSVVELGTLHGWDALELQRRGASVVACDGYYNLETARRLLEAKIEYWASPTFDLDYPVRVPRQFDWVFCLNILYHLRNPVQGLETARAFCKEAGHVLVESAAGQGRCADIPVDIPALWAPAEPWVNDPTNYFIPNLEAGSALCRMAGLRVIKTAWFDDNPKHPRAAYLCAPIPGWKPFRWDT